MNNQHENLKDADERQPQESFGSQMFGHIKTSIIATVVLALIVSGIYPLIVFGLAQMIFPHQANGSLIGKDGKPASNDADAIGSALIGQNFSDAKYFHPRPSAAGSGYDATASGGSNLGPTSAKLINGTIKKDDKGKEVVDNDGIEDRIVHYCLDNNLPYESSIPIKQFQDAQGNLDDVKLIKAFKDDKTPLVFTPRQPIPADAVTASASGLDPHISVENAKVQAARVADARKISVDKVNELIGQFTDHPSLGLFGESGVNVLRLNLELDQIAPVTPPATNAAISNGPR
ncbi:MAG TPA: potassium-transporting ATPase subunit C [Humisphaera sp.]|jgi:K+-transporting ATPase ATPase C chain|nr:potassium-transporting ATPase subunit C [Humisphaera sp.]